MRKQDFPKKWILQFFGPRGKNWKQSRFLHWKKTLGPKKWVLDELQTQNHPDFKKMIFFEEKTVFF